MDLHCFPFCLHCLVAFLSFELICNYSNISSVRKFRTITVSITLMFLSFWTDRFWQTVQTQIRLLLEEQSDQGLHCLLFNLHLFDEIP